MKVIVPYTEETLYGPEDYRLMRELHLSADFLLDWVLNNWNLFDVEVPDKALAHLNAYLEGVLASMTEQDELEVRRQEAVLEEGIAHLAASQARVHSVLRRALGDMPHHWQGNVMVNASHFPFGTKAMVIDLDYDE